MSLIKLHAIFLFIFLDWELPPHPQAMRKDHVVFRNSYYDRYFLMKNGGEISACPGLSLPPPLQAKTFLKSSKVRK